MAMTETTGDVKVLFLRGSDAAIDVYVGVEGEIVVDRVNKTVRLMDGTTPGGIRLATVADLQAA